MNTFKKDTSNLKNSTEPTHRVDLSSNLFGSGGEEIDGNSTLITKFYEQNTLGLAPNALHSPLSTVSQLAQITKLEHSRILECLSGPIIPPPSTSRINNLPGLENVSAGVNLPISQNNLSGIHTPIDFRETLLLDYALNSSKFIRSPNDNSDHVVPIISVSSIILPPEQIATQGINSKHTEFDMLSIIRSMSPAIENQPQLYDNPISTNTESKSIIQELSQRLEDLALKIDSIGMFLEPREINIKPTSEQSARSLLQDIRTEITLIKGLASHITQPSNLRTDVERMTFNSRQSHVSEKNLYDDQTWLPMEEAAEMLGITRRAVNRIVEKGYARTNTLKVPVQVEYEVEKTLVSLPDLFQYRENPPKGGRPRKDGLQIESQQQSTSSPLEQYQLFLEQSNQ